MNIILLVISLQGKVNEKRENSSITVSKYILPCIDDGQVPLKSIFSRNGSLAFMNVPSPLVMNFGFKYWQNVQEFVTLFIWSKENGRFLALVMSKRRVTL